VERGQSCHVAVVGGGPAGLTAAIYAARAGLDVVVLERGVSGGQVFSTFAIENYPGFPGGIAGPELASRMEEQARAWGARIEMSEVGRLELPAGPPGGMFRLMASKMSLQAQAVVVASGQRPRWLGVPGEERLRGRGVSYCATCDGPLFRDRRLIVVGGGDSAAEEALFLARYARQVTIVHRRAGLRAVHQLQERARRHERIGFLLESAVEEITGADRVEAARVKHLPSGRVESVPCDGVFIYIGGLPNSGFLPDEIRRDAFGYVITDDRLATSVPGVFAAGDVRAAHLRQVTTAVGDGALAAVSAQRYVEARA
jgi:thioredoxin reductase (NADPH)